MRRVGNGLALFDFHRYLAQGVKLFDWCRDLDSGLDGVE